MVATLCGNRNNDINKIRIFSRVGPAWRRGLGHALAEIRCDNKTTKKEGGVAEQQPGKQLTLCKPLRSSYQQKRPANAGRGSMYRSHLQVAMEAELNLRTRVAPVPDPIQTDLYH